MTLNDVLIWLDAKTAEANSNSLRCDKHGLRYSALAHAGESSAYGYAAMHIRLTMSAEETQSQSTTQATSQSGSSATERTA